MEKHSIKSFFTETYPLPLFFLVNLCALILSFSGSFISVWDARCLILFIATVTFLTFSFYLFNRSFEKTLLRPEQSFQNRLFFFIPPLHLMDFLLITLNPFCLGKLDSPSFFFSLEELLVFLLFCFLFFKPKKKIRNSLLLPKKSFLPIELTSDKKRFGRSLVCFFLCFVSVFLLSFASPKGRVEPVSRAFSAASSSGGVNYSSLKINQWPDNSEAFSFADGFSANSDLSFPEFAPVGLDGESGSTFTFANQTFISSFISFRTFSVYENTKTGEIVNDSSSLGYEYKTNLSTSLNEVPVCPSRATAEAMVEAGGLNDYSDLLGLSFSFLLPTNEGQNSFNGRIVNILTSTSPSSAYYDALFGSYFVIPRTSIPAASSSKICAIVPMPEFSYICRDECLFIAQALSFSSERTTCLSCLNGGFVPNASIQEYWSFLCISSSTSIPLLVSFFLVFSLSSICLLVFQTKQPHSKVALSGKQPFFKYGVFLPLFTTFIVLLIQFFLSFFGKSFWITSSTPLFGAELCSLLLFYFLTFVSPFWRNYEDVCQTL